jgi:hypothetical protein
MARSTSARRIARFSPAMTVVDIVTIPTRHTDMIRP